MYTVASTIIYIIILFDWIYENGVAEKCFPSHQVSQTHFMTSRKRRVQIRKI